MKCIISSKSETICELEKALNEVGVQLGHVGEIVEYIEKYGNVVLAKIKLPYFEPKNKFDKNYLLLNKILWYKSGDFEVLLPYEFITEVEEDEAT